VLPGPSTSAWRSTVSQGAAGPGVGQFLFRGGGGVANAVGGFRRRGWRLATSCSSGVTCAANSAAPRSSTGGVDANTPRRSEPEDTAGGEGGVRTLGRRAEDGIERRRALQRCHAGR